MGKIAGAISRGLSLFKLRQATADPGDVLNGKLFFSKSKEMKTGTLSLSGNAAAGDVVKGKTFYNTDAKTKQTGTLYDAGVEPQGYGVGQYNPGNGLNFYIYLPNETSNQRNSAKVTRSLRYPATAFGNAAASSVLSGATFSSTAGLKVSGTMANRGAVSTTVAPGGSYTIAAGYHNGGGKVYGGTSWQFVWGFLWHSNRNYYTFGTNSLFGTASGSTWTCKRAGNYRIRAIYSDSIGASGVGVKKNGSWLMNGMFGDKTQDVSLAVGNTIQIVGGAIYGDPYGPCVATIVIWAI